MKLVLVVAAAIHALAPNLSRETRINYAKVICAESARAGVDPLLPVAIFEHESRWHTQADNGKCVGLGQVCLSTQRACQGGLDTPECQARRAQLFDGPTNIRTSVRMLGEWKIKCRQLTGRAENQHILSGYAGLDGSEVHCGQVKNSAKKHWRNTKQHRIVTDILRVYQALGRKARKARH